MRFSDPVLLLTSFQVMKWGFHVSSFYSPDFKLHEVFRLYFTPFWVKIWSSHILLDILCNEELLINCAGVVNRIETCLSPSSAFNYRTLKIINRQVFPLGVMYRRFPLTHEVVCKKEILTEMNKPWYTVSGRRRPWCFTTTHLVWS
jgi:hypothetical protein